MADFIFAYFMFAFFILIFTQDEYRNITSVLAAALFWPITLFVALMKNLKEK